MLDLSGNWTLRDAQGSHSVQMAIPGDAISALLAAQKIEDPYYGRNEYDVRWIADLDWTASRRFNFVVEAGVRYDFDVSQLDCVADIKLNGVAILSARNMFRFFTVDVTDVLKDGDNEIEILFHSNTKEATRLQKLQPYPVPYQKGNCDIADGNMLRKIQCDFGWDWGVALAPFGLYGNISIRPVSVRIGQICVDQHHVDGMVKLEVKAKISGDVSGQDYCFEFDGQVINGISDGSVVSAEFNISNPKIWWPAGSGEQPLYELKLKVGDWQEVRNVGLRTVELETLDDEAGKSFAFKVNGKNIYMRGANWIPADALPSNISDEKTLDLLQSAVDANMNMIRVWGGGRYEADSFYEECSKLGLLVWQDFMFACNIYPSDEEFLAEVAAEACEQVARLSHHACLALWCGDNELVGALTWFEETLKNRDLYLVGYDRLNRVIEQSLNKTIDNAVWWPSSPSSGPMNFGDAWHDDSSGDMHYWSVWHEGKSFDNYLKINPRFCSEFGFQSFPSMNTIRTFASKADMNIASPVMESHQKNAGGNARIAETMFRYFRFPIGFENFVYVSQIQQGLAIRTAVEYWRSIKPHCMGTLYWQLNDVWPVASWASLDYGGDWKLMHYMVKRFYQSVAVSIIPDGDLLKIQAVNDLHENVKLDVELSLIALDGTTKLLNNVSGNVGPDAAKTLATIKTADIDADHILGYKFNASNGMQGADHYTPVAYKVLDLSDPKITFTTRIDNASVIVNISSDSLALFVTVEADVAGRYSDNCFMMTKNDECELVFTPKDGTTLAALRAAEKSIVVRDLYTSTYET
ncbi:MAG: glycoside hydrolase family 2 protein [Rhizobiales bacterium]|nr:glycoside hydrolase family 2 protein [Hyphomicrobiales bacterium]NRB14473.1 glycoside hydrolase family 2 protein [Hyphomicrobiales bacterium]